MPSDPHDGPPGDIIVCITAEALSVISPTGEVVDDRGDALQQLLADTSRLQPLFAESQSRLRQQAADWRARSGPGIPDLSRFYRVETTDADRRRAPQDFVDRLRAEGLIEEAYFKHPHELAVGVEAAGTAAAATAAEPAFPTPDFTELQGYLGPAPAGVDARYAWTGPGGYGEGVRIIDIENAWRFSHEDLLTNQGGALNTPSDDLAARNHGTAVVGIMSGDLNAFGITGICPGATISGISVDGEVGGSAPAIRRAADRLRPGDIVLIEDHTAGPVSIEEAMQASRTGSTLGYVPVEIWPDDFAAIKHVTDRGVIVVAAAGNGQRNLDQVDDLLTSASGGRWANPFERREADSGAIFVGAGAPPGGAEPDRSRLGFSNWGTCVDAQGWGRRVVTTGGVRDQEGDLQGGPYEDRWYTRTFSGTSSAAPMIAGVLACVQGVLRAAGSAPLSPAQARALLRITGSPQAASADGSLERIGSRPNLQELIPRALMFSEGADYLDGAEAACDGPSVAIFIGDGGGGWRSAWDGPRWGGPRWGGPRWGGPRWGGPRWGGPRWGGPSSPRPFEPGSPFAAGTGGLPETHDGGRRETRRPGFST
jgi:hypothetical protein